MYDTLLQLPLFQGLCPNDFTRILGKIKLHFSKHKAGEKIITEGESCNKLVFLLKGELMSESTDRYEQFSFYEYFQPPFVVEPYSLFGMHTQYVSSYIAQTEVHLVTIDKSFVLTDLNKYDIFRLNYLNIISNRSQTLYNRIWDTKVEDTASRIINFILYHTEKPSGEKLFKIKMDDFAHLLGETRLTISKALNELQDKGLLSLKRKEIVVPDITLLIKYQEQ